jgi:hypothetical protein
MVQLGRIARTEPALSDAALNALEDIDQLRSNAIATSVRDELRHRSAAMPKKRERSAEEPTSARRAPALN